MKSKIYRLPYGKSSLEFRLPPGMQASLAVSKPAPPLEDPRAAIRQALDRPIGSPRLAELARPGQTVCIVFTDVTRASPDHLLVPAMLEELEGAGVRQEDITLLCGTGLHRPSTPEEKAAKLGASIVRRYRVIDNQAQNPAVQSDLGTTPGGVPVLIHRAAVEADLLIATGIVEPHQYAGYSGGSKTAAVGAAGEALIAHTHGPAFVDHPGSRLGRIDDNPFQEAVQEAGRRAGLRFILNVVLDDEGRLLKVAAGDPLLAFRELVDFARSIYEVPVPQQYDLALGGVGYPKDSNLYQASRAASYLYFAPIPVVRPGGFLIIPARCEEGAGSGVGEQRFLKAMRDAPSIQSILDDARRNGYPPGQQRAFVMAKVLEGARVVIVGSQTPELVTACKMTPAASMEQALAMAAERLGSNCRVLIVPKALHTLPIVTR
jgi:nickel-dependent lactate racemase